MAEKKLKGKKIAVVATDGFEQSELEKPIQAIKDAGGTYEIVSPKSGTIRGWDSTDWGNEFQVDRKIKEANPADYDGLLLPGGVLNPDQLRTDESVINFVKAFFKEGKQKPVAAICHGPWTLINAGVVKGRHMTSYKSIRLDLENAGVKWTDEEVVVDNGLVTSRNPKDLPAFNKKMVEEFCEGRHQVQQAV